MNYYPFHIGDFRSGTVNMTRLARWIYRDMLDVYYDSEKPLPLDLEQLCDTIGAEADDERKIVERLLRFKFKETDDGYRHLACDKVIANYRLKGETAKANGSLGGRPKKAKANPKEPSGFPLGSNPVATGNPAETGSEANQEPITNNQDKDHPALRTSLINQHDATEEKPRGVTAVDLSIAMRKCGVMTQPANPILQALAAQGVTVETAVSACEEAKLSKPGEKIGLAYVAKIIERWASAAEKLKAQGAAAPKREGNWWATPASVLAKCAELNMKTYAGESMDTLKGRIKAAIDNGGVEPKQKPGPVLTIAIAPEEKAPVRKPAGAPSLASMIKVREMA